MQRSKVLTVLILVVLVLNSLIILRSQDLLHFPGEITPLDMARAGTNAMLSYLQKYAEDMGVGDSNAVNESIGLLQYKINTAKSNENLAKIVINESRLVQDIISREAENMRQQVILNIISEDPNLPLITEKETFVVLSDSELGLNIDDLQHRLSAETVQALLAAEELKTPFSEVVVEVENGVPKILTYRRLYDRLAALEHEVVYLQQNLIDREISAGYRSMTGSGIIVRIFDAEGGYREDEIVHDVDVRDILNELFSAGAVGASVGGERIMSNSSIRCVGSVVLVNHQPVSVNPVIITAIGDPILLSSGISLIKNTLEVVKGIRIEVEQKEDLVLPAYQKTIQ